MSFIDRTTRSWLWIDEILYSFLKQNFVTRHWKMIYDMGHNIFWMSKKVLDYNHAFCLNTSLTLDCLHLSQVYGRLFKARSHVYGRCSYSFLYNDVNSCNTMKENRIQHMKGWKNYSREMLFANEVDY